MTSNGWLRWTSVWVLVAGGVGCGDNGELVDTDPAVSASATPTTGGEPLLVNFDCTVTGGEAPVDVLWTFGDGSQSPVPKTAFTYVTPGTYVATCVATDRDGDQASASVMVTVGIPDRKPMAVASTQDACAVPTHTLVRLDGTQSSDPEGEPLSFMWEFFTTPPGSTVEFNNPTIANPSFVPDRAGTYEIRLRVSDGKSTTVSDVLTVDAQGASTIVIVSGNNQTGTVGTTLAQPLEVAAQNSCGATVPDATVRWVGTNATPRDPADVTDQIGAANTPAMLGTVAGTASVDATLVGADDMEIQTVTFAITANPDVASMLVLDDMSTGVGVTSTPIDAVVRVSDRFGNAVTTTAVTFTASFLDGTAQFDDGTGDCSAPVATKTMTTANGIATLALCAQTLESVHVSFTQVTPTSVNRVGGRHTFVTDDMETELPGYFTGANPPENVWVRGAPTFPANLAVPSGTQVRGTGLDGELVPALSCTSGQTAMRQVLDLTYPGQVYRAELSAQSFVDLANDGQCCPASAAVWAGCVGCTLLTPTNDAYDVVGPMMPGCGPGFRRRETAFHNLTFDVTPFAGQQVPIFTNIFHGDDVHGAGWYIDDVAVRGLVNPPTIKFVAGEPADVVLTTVREGCNAPVVRGQLVDEFGNPSSKSGVTVQLTVDGTATFSAVNSGTNATGVGTNSVSLQSVDGRFRVTLADTVAETVTVTAMVGTASGTTSVAITADACFIFADDMESGVGGWTHELISSAGPTCTTDNWALSTVRSSSATTSWHSGPAQACQGDTRLISPSIDLTSYAPMTPIRLSFNHFYQFDDCADPTFRPDGGIVEVSVDGGPFMPITPVGGYPHVLDFVCTNPLEGQPAYAQSSGPMFQSQMFGLGGFAGSTIRIAFHVGWDCGNCAVTEGWYVDDVLVELGSAMPFAPNKPAPAQYRDPSIYGDNEDETSPAQPKTGGGCATSAGAGWMFGLLAIALLQRRRRGRA